MGNFGNSTARRYGATGLLRRSRRALLWLALICPALSTTALTAELRGRIWDTSTGKAPAGAELALSCGGQPNPHPLGGNGAYSIRDVPSGNCKITVKTSRGKASRTIAINRPVVKFSGETSAVGNGIVLIPR